MHALNSMELYVISAFHLRTQKKSQDAAAPGS